MIVLLSILVVILAILLLKVGVDAAYASAQFSLKIVAGPLRIQLLPKAAKKSAANKKPKAKKTKAPKEKKPAQKKEKKPPDMQFFLELAKLGLRALNRFRISLHVDVFHLRFISASNDPYKTAMNSAYVTAALNLLAPHAKRAFRVKDAQVEVGTDFFEEKPQISARLALTIRIWRILYVALAFGFEFLGARMKKKKRAKLKAAASEVKAAAESAAEDKQAAKLA